jgi:exonuclease VII large subunit
LTGLVNQAHQIRQGRRNKRLQPQITTTNPHKDTIKKHNDDNLAILTDTANAVATDSKQDAKPPRLTFTARTSVMSGTKLIQLLEEQATLREGYAMVTHEEAKFIKERTNAQALTNSTTPTTTKDSSCGTYHRHNTQHPTEQKPLAYRPTQATNNSTCTHYTTTCLHHSPNHTASQPKPQLNRSLLMMTTLQ